MGAGGSSRDGTRGPAPGGGYALSVDRAPSPSRWLALAEVLVAFAAMHAAFRGFQKSTAWGLADVSSGLNLAPGLAMVLVAAAAIRLRGRRLPDGGLRLGPIDPGLDAALAAVLVLAVVGGICFAAGAALPRIPTGPVEALRVIVPLLVASGILAVLLGRPRSGFGSFPRPLRNLLLLSVPTISLVLAFGGTGPALDRLLPLVGLVLGAGFGEEIFFRGYVQGRLNEAFGRPWQILGTRFGPGLFLAALLFGLVHALNPFDWFRMEGRFALWHGAAAALSLHAGLLRERTHGILAPALVHSFSDLVVRWPLKG